MLKIRQDLELLIPLNKRIFLFFNQHRFSLLDKLFRYFIYLGKGQTTFLYLPILLWGNSLTESSNPFFVFIHTAISLAFLSLICNILKSTFRQHRPSGIIPETIVVEGVYHKSFPSSDTAFIISITTIAALHLSWAFFISFILVSLIVAYGRMYLGSHFPFDIIVGGMIGWASTYYTLPYIELVIRTFSI